MMFLKSNSCSNLLNKKIKDIYKTINNTEKIKLCINMMIKGPLHKQIIVSIGNENISKFMSSSSEYVTNLNKALKDIKSDIFISFIKSNYCSLIIILNRVTSPLDLTVIKNYIKNINSVNTNDIQSTCLFQFKSYLKILGISYFIKDTNIPVNSSMIETIIKFTHIFNNIHIAFKL